METWAKTSCCKIILLHTKGVVAPFPATARKQSCSVLETWREDFQCGSHQVQAARNQDFRWLSFPHVSVGHCNRKQNTKHCIHKHEASLAEDVAKQLVTSCVLSRLDYCNCLLMGTPSSVVQPMQKYLKQLHASFSEHHSTKTAYLTYSNSTGS